MNGSRRRGERVSGNCLKSGACLRDGGSSKRWGATSCSSLLASTNRGDQVKQSAKIGELRLYFIIFLFEWLGSQQWKSRIESRLLNLRGQDLNNHGLTIQTLRLRRIHAYCFASIRSEFGGRRACNRPFQSGGE